MDDSKYTWVTLASFWSAAEALFFKNVLEGNGIPAFVRNEHLGQLLPHFTLAGVDGGLQLQVPSDCLDAARQILDGAFDDETEEYDAQEDPESEDEMEV